MRRHQKWAPLAKSMRGILQNLPRITIAILLVSSAYQYLHYGRHDPFKCNSLLAEGTWQSRGDSPRPEHAFEAWRPSSCTMHSYSAADIKTCLFGRRLVFAGDSTTRQLFWSALRRLNRETYDREIRRFAILSDRAINLSLLVNHVELDFIWDPWLNSTELFGQLSRFRPRPGTPDYEKLAKTEGRDSPASIILGTPGLWAARNTDTRYLGAFSEGIHTVMHYLRGSISSSVFLPEARAQAAYGELSNYVLLTPVPVPAYDKLSFGRNGKITPAKIEAMNWNLENSNSLDQSHVMWSYNLMTDGPNDAYDEDGLHVLNRVADWRLDIILNARCNAGLARTSAVANKVTCCVPYPPPTRIQILLLVLALLGLPWLLLDRDQDAFRTTEARCAVTTLIAMASVLLVAGYCFLADRTHLFDKQARHFDAPSFAWSLLATGTLAIGSIRVNRSGFPSPTQCSPIRFLGRGQTDELKGWLQGFLLLYNFHGASESQAMYMVFRFSISAYLFLSCYGHARYFLTTEDYSFARAACALCRLNLLSCILSFTLNTTWSLQYFSLLASVWFCVTYATLATFSNLNANPTLLLLKVIATCTVTTGVIQAPGVLGGVLLALNKGFGIVGDLEKVYFHLSVDRFVPMFGILVATVVHRFALLRQPQVGKKGMLLNAGAPFDRLNTAFDRELLDMVYPGKDAIPLKAMAICFSVAYLAVFCILGFAAKVYGDSDTYDTYHPYVSPWLVLAAAIVRNGHAGLRKRQVTGAMALGRISLEVSVLQLHIWLAGDGTAILRIGSAGRHGAWPSSLARPAELIILTIVLLWAAVKCRSSTQQVMKWLRLEADDDDQWAAINRQRSSLGTVKLSQEAAGQPGQDDIEEQKPCDDDRQTASRRGPEWKVAGILAFLWLCNMAYGEQ